MERLRIVLGSACLLAYPEGGGHWSAFRQYLCGLDALGHDVFWLEVMQRPTKRPFSQCLATFADRMASWGFAGRWAVVIHDEPAFVSLDACEIHGVSPAHLRSVIGDADMLWNFACMLRSPLLQMFRRCVVIDLDPGIMQVSALDFDLDLDHHDVHFTVGLNVGRADCLIPAVGEKWIPFPPIVHVPLWPAQESPDESATFTSITQWGWGELHLDGRVLSVSKRDAYMHYVDVPRKCGRSFELAANLDRRDPTGDLPRLDAGGWRLVDPNLIVADPNAYQRYITRSRGEFCCPKPIYRDLRTGWLSDRSAAYLVSGRPVVMENTGLDHHLPLGTGLVCFSNIGEAVEAIHGVVGDYARHSIMARELACEHLAATRVLPSMLERCA